MTATALGLTLNLLEALLVPGTRRARLKAQRLAGRRFWDESVARVHAFTELLERVGPLWGWILIAFGFRMRLVAELLVS